MTFEQRIAQAVAAALAGERATKRARRSTPRRGEASHRAVYNAPASHAPSPTSTLATVALVAGKRGPELQFAVAPRDVAGPDVARAITDALRGHEKLAKGTMRDCVACMARTRAQVAGCDAHRALWRWNEATGTWYAADPTDPRTKPALDRAIALAQSAGFTLVTA